VGIHGQGEGSLLNPRNVGEIEDPDGMGEVGSLACGDALRLSFKLDERNGSRTLNLKPSGVRVLLRHPLP